MLLFESQKAQLLNTFCFANASEPTVNNCWSPAIYFEDFAVNITNPFDHSNYTLKLSDTDIVCKSAVNLTCVLQKGAVSYGMATIACLQQLGACVTFDLGAVCPEA